MKSPLVEIGASFSKLGCTSFGGPIAHLGYLREEFVVRRRWLDDAAYADLVALCQFLPGPASSQLVFALGMKRGGLAGALLASLCFTLPSALLMIGFAYGVSGLADLGSAGWLHGLKLAAVAVVAQAVWGMGRKLCPDPVRVALALAAAGAVVLVPGALCQVVVIVVGALAGRWLSRNGIAGVANAQTRRAGRHGWAAVALIAWAALLAILPLIERGTGEKAVAVFDGFYRAGSLVFGGGHVVLPLLRAEVVPTEWIHDDVFLAGYGAAQAVPGPLFTFAAYLGTAMAPVGSHAWAMGLWCLLAIFLPAWLLIGGALPFWDLLRRKAWAQAAMRGANAAVVGVLLAALYDPVWKEGVKSATDVIAVVALFVLLEIWRLPAWLAVIIAAAAGQWIL